MLIPVYMFQVLMSVSVFPHPNSRTFLKLIIAVCCALYSSVVQKYGR
jgi:hypothetical protein